MPRFRVPPGVDASLTTFLRDRVGTSLRRARDWIRAGRVTVDGRTVTDPAWRPPAGAEVELHDRAPEPRVRPVLSGPGFRVLHLDAALAVVDKDPGIVTIPTTDPDPDDLPLVARVLAVLAAAGRGGGGELHVVHRIDRETSGLVLFARTGRDAARLREQFRARRPLREYLGWTAGVPAAETGTLRHLLAEPDPGREVTVVETAARGAREAVLEYRVEAARDEPLPRARVRFRLVTGRRNQVRVQAAASGWPLLGDRWYGIGGDPGPGRLALHAARLGFVHPRTGRDVLFEAPLPPDLLALDRELFGGD